MNDGTMQLGLLMETAQAQQKAADAVLRRLSETVTGMDAVIREEMRRAFVEEFQSLMAASQLEQETLDRLRRSMGLRTASWVIAVSVASAIVPCLMGWLLLPSRAEVARLRAEREELAQNIAELQQRAGHVDLRRCGDSGRLCVRIDRSAPAYGANGEYVVLKGP